MRSLNASPTSYADRKPNTPAVNIAQRNLISDMTQSYDFNASSGVIGKQLNGRGRNIMSNCTLPAEQQVVPVQ